MRELALFAGAGGGILGGLLLGWRAVCAVEIDAYARNVLLARQRDGILEPFPIWDDVATFDGRPWRGFVDVVSGGFPCQDISAAGKGAGLNGERSGLWSEFARIIGEVQPAYVFVENSPILTSRGLGVVLGDLSALGFDARWGVFSAGDVGARHERERLFLVAHRDGELGEARPWTVRQYGQLAHERKCDTGDACGCFETWLAMAGELAGMPDAVADRMDRTRTIGNGQVPAVARLAFETLSGIPKPFTNK